MASTRCRRRLRAALLVSAALLALALVGGYLCLGFSACTPAGDAGDQAGTSAAELALGDVGSGGSSGASAPGSDEGSRKGSGSGDGEASAGDAQTDAAGGADGAVDASSAQALDGLADVTAEALNGLSSEGVTKLLSSSDASNAKTEEFCSSVSDVAGALIKRYREQTGTTLAHAGWLDLVGRCWGCVVVGPGWVDVCLVSGTDEACAAQTIRMEVEEWRRIYGGQ